MTRGSTGCNCCRLCCPNGFSLGEISATLLPDNVCQKSPSVDPSLAAGKAGQKTIPNSFLSPDVNEDAYCEKRLNCSGTSRDREKGSRSEPTGITMTCLKGSSTPATPADLTTRSRITCKKREKQGKRGSGAGFCQMLKQRLANRM